MFFEAAVITVTDPTGFEAAVAEARPRFLATAGCHGLWLHRVVETPEVYRLIVAWERVEDHMVTFRNSEGFQVWRRLPRRFSPRCRSSPIRTRLHWPTEAHREIPLPERPRRQTEL